MKKGVIIAIVIVVVVVIFFAFSGKKGSEESGDGVTETMKKWDLTKGRWTLAEREEALRGITRMMGYLNPGGPWESWKYDGHSGAVGTAAYQLWYAEDRAQKQGSSKYAIPYVSSFGVWVEQVKDNGVWGAALEQADSIMKSSSR